MIDIGYVGDFYALLGRLVCSRRVRCCAWRERPPLLTLPRLWRLGSGLIRPRSSQTLPGRGLVTFMFLSRARTFRSCVRLQSTMRNGRSQTTLWSTAITGFCFGRTTLVPAVLNSRVVSQETPSTSSSTLWAQRCARNRRLVASRPLRTFSDAGPVSRCRRGRRRTCAWAGRRSSSARRPLPAALDAGVGTPVSANGPGYEHPKSLFQRYEPARRPERSGSRRSVSEGAPRGAPPVRSCHLWHA